MNRLFTPLLILLAVFSTSFSWNTASEDQIIGEWLTGNQKAKIKIFKKDNKYYGAISWLKEPTYADGTPKRDKNNPDASKRNQPIMGLLLLTGFEYDDDNEWEDGHIYDPEEGKTYSCNLTLKDNGNKLDVRGYIGISLIGRTDVWTRSGK